MNITLVVAASENNAIGRDNQLLWHLPKDMRFFKNTTWGLPVLMGRKTFESMGSKLLPGRYNIILTTQQGYTVEGATVVHTIEQAIELAAQQDYKELMVIGGGQIYEMTLPIADTIWLTRVHVEIDGDTFFPALDEQWTKVSRASNYPDEKHPFSFDFECWKRK